MHPFDRTLAPEVTDDELAQAVDAEPLPFPEVEEQDDDSDEPQARAFVAVSPNTPNEALANAKKFTDDSTFVGVGMCLKTVRTYFGVPALWPDAETAWEHSAPMHKTGDPLKIPRGAPVYWTNGRHGHIALSLGGGLCRTTDYHRAGMVDVALIERLAAWCGGSLVGWGEVLNGVDVWPNPKKPKPKTPPKSWTWQRRVQFLRNEAVRQQRDGHGPRAQQLRDWADKIAARHR